MLRLIRTAGLLCVLSCGPAAADAALPWFDEGRPNAEARQAVALLSAAPDDGLLAADYDAEALRAALERASNGPSPELAQAEALDHALSAAMQRFLEDLHYGRIDPSTIQNAFTPPARGGFDAGERLRAALAAHQLPELVREAAPQLPAYSRLRGVLARYRQLADDPAWQQPLPPLPVVARGRPGKLESGAAYSGLAMLAARLVALGDLAADAPLPVVYAEPLIGPVQSFQERHGLPADGVIGRATLAQLEVRPAARARQIALTMERLRWTPLFEGPRMIIINIPEFILRAYEVVDGQIVVRTTMRVIVGKSLDTRTPLFDATMRYIEFSPYWNVPPSIERAEIVPKLRAKPSYWTKEGFEFVAPDGTVLTGLSRERLDAVLAGRLRIRQRPGERNALGDIKFVFPNHDNIYLHHTPAVGLFERERRDFSHGCIRVEQPVELAKFVLAGMPEWTEERIREAMGKGESATLRIGQPVPVVLAYGTALVKGGRSYFFDDIYGQDELLGATLSQRPPWSAKLD
jgi:murein L,D-transpeptidase YcbB/YkuD